MRCIGYLTGYEVVHSCQLEKEQENLRKWTEDQRKNRKHRRKRKPKVTPHVPYYLRDNIYKGDRNKSDWCFTKSTLYQRYDISEILLDFFRYGRRNFSLKHLGNIFDEAMNRVNKKSDKYKTGGSIGMDKKHLIEAVQYLVMGYAEDVNMGLVADELKKSKKKTPKKSLADYARALVIERLTSHRGSDITEQETESIDIDGENKDIEEILEIWKKGIDWKKVIDNLNKYAGKDFFMYVIREHMKELKGNDFDFDDLEGRRPVFNRQEMAACWRAVKEKVNQKLLQKKHRFEPAYLCMVKRFADLANATLTSHRSNMSLERIGLKHFLKQRFQTIF